MDSYLIPTLDVTVTGETMKEEKAGDCHAEGPAGYNGGKGPGEALKMPTKSYPQSQAGIPKGGGKNTTLEGPCDLGYKH